MTEKQEELILKLADELDEEVDITNLSKQEASKLIQELLDMKADREFDK